MKKKNKLKHANLLPIPQSVAVLLIVRSSLLIFSLGHSLHFVLLIEIHLSKAVCQSCRINDGKTSKKKQEL